MNWFSHTAEGKKFLLIDIASDSVGVGVVAVFPDAKPTLLFAARAPIALAPRLEPAHFFSATLHALNDICARASALYRAEVAGAQKVHIFLNSPWVVSKTRSVRVDFPELTTLTPDTLTAVIQEAEKGITDNFRAAHREIAEAVRVVEKKITEFRVNGYTVSSAIGKDARTLELTLLEGFAPEHAISRFGSVLDTLSHTPREWHGAAAACSGALSLSAHEQNDMLAVCAGGEATELATLRGGIVQEIISIPFGIRAAARAGCDAGAFNSAVSAETILRSASVGVLAGARRATVEHARAEAIVHMRHSLVTALAPKIKSGFAPARSVLLSDERNLPFFDSALREPLFDASEPNFPSTFSVLGASAFSSSIQFARAATPDTFLAGEAAFVGFYENGSKL